MLVKKGYDLFSRMQDCGWGDRAKEPHYNESKKVLCSGGGGGGEEDQSHSPRARLDVGIMQFRFWIRVLRAVGAQVRRAAG